MRTGAKLAEEPLQADTWEAAGRAPFAFETSLPGVFAIGDVRSDSVKRVGAASGDGSAVVAQLHAYLASTAASKSRRASMRGPSETVHPGEGLQQEVGGR